MKKSLSAWLLTALLTLPAHAGLTPGGSGGGGSVNSVTGTSPIASSGGTDPAISITNAAADGSTKGAATFTAADFNSSTGLISLDYTNGQAASGSNKGFLTSADWTTFNAKGSVSSVAMTVPNILSVSGSPVSTSGTLALSLATQSQNLIFAGPGSGSAATPTFRALVALDIPSLDASKITTGTLADAQLPSPTTSAISASAIDWSILKVKAGAYTKTLGANTTFTFSNQTAGQTIVVRLTNTASNYTVTWPSVKWPGASAPVMTIGATSDIYTFIYDGTNTFGSFVQDLH